MANIKVIDGPLYQWDTGRRVLIETHDGEAVDYVHYSNGMVAEVTNSDGITTAPIPNILLQTAGKITICAVVVGSDCCRTTCDCSFGVWEKAKPEDYVYTESEIYTIKTAVEKALAEAKESGEFDGEPGKDGAPGKDGVDGKDADVSLLSQGRHSKYRFTSPGWKRIQHIIRGTHGTLEIGIATGYPYRMVQVLGLDLSGFVKFPLDTNAKAKPVLIKRYENIFGEDEAVADPTVKITAVRIGYPKKGTSFPQTDGATNYTDNPVNCYVDVYVDYFDSHEHYRNIYLTSSYLTGVKYDDTPAGDDTPLGFTYYVASAAVVDGLLRINLEGKIAEVSYFPGMRIPKAGEIMVQKTVKGEDRLYFTADQTVAFDMNFSGFSESHNCEAITEETNASSKGIYGEELEFYSVDIAKMQTYMNTAHLGSTNYGIQMHSAGVLSVVPASESAIDGRANAYLVITPKNLKYAVDSVLKEHGLI